MTFKQLVKIIANIENDDDRAAVFGLINRSFETEKISWNDHELLYRLAEGFNAEP